MWFNASMPVPPESKAGTTRRVRGAGLDLSVTERGDTSQPTVLLVHGFPDTSAVWRPVAELLAADFHVVTYDVRGSGDSDVPSSRSDYLLPLLVDDLAAVADAVSPDAPVHLVAHDWGSIQGWEAVVTPRLAGQVSSVVTFSTRCSAWAHTLDACLFRKRSSGMNGRWKKPMYHECRPWRSPAQRSDNDRVRCRRAHSAAWSSGGPEIEV
jgi:pimeloyl-ACP methyl ester carboxylesterase